jgi:hypothetical protein
MLCQLYLIYVLHIRRCLYCFKGCGKHFQYPPTHSITLGEGLNALWAVSCSPERISVSTVMRKSLFRFLVSLVYSCMLSLSFLQQGKPAGEQRLTVAVWLIHVPPVSRYLDTPRLADAAYRIMWLYICRPTVGLLFHVHCVSCQQQIRQSHCKLDLFKHVRDCLGSFTWPETKHAELCALSFTWYRLKSETR